MFEQGGIGEEDSSAQVADVVAFLFSLFDFQFKIRLRRVGIF